MEWLILLYVAPGIAVTLWIATFAKERIAYEYSSKPTWLATLMILAFILIVLIVWPYWLVRLLKNKG
jgi:hypothetical protein